jgi:hypothetical protein
MAEKTSNLPAVIKTLAIANMDIETVVDVMRESSLDGGDGLSPFDLDRIQFPSAGSLTYAVPTDEGKKRAVETLDAIVLHHHPIRQFYEGNYDPSTPTAPRCTSADGMRGVGNPGGDCLKCRFGEFNCGCKQYRVLYLLFPENQAPTLLVLPRTSLNPARKYLRKLALTGTHCYGLITKIGLTERRSGPGMVATFAPGPKLTPEMLAIVRAYAQAFRASIAFPSVPSAASGGGDPTQDGGTYAGDTDPDPDDDDIEF